MKNDGGPAFPAHEDHFWQGISKRDYFASAAMQALISNGGFYNQTSTHDTQIAIRAYKIADDMLRERSADNGGKEKS